MLQYPLAVSNNTSKQLCNVGRCHVDRCNLSIHLSHIILYLTISIWQRPFNWAVELFVFWVTITEVKKSRLLAGPWVPYIAVSQLWVYFELVRGWAWQVWECFRTQIVEELFATFALWPWWYVCEFEYHFSFSQALTKASAKLAPTRRCLEFASPYLWEHLRARLEEIYTFWTDPAGLQQAPGLHFFFIFTDNPRRSVFIAFYKQYDPLGTKLRRWKKVPWDTMSGHFRASFHFSGPCQIWELEQESSGLLLGTRASIIFTLWCCYTDHIARTFWISISQSWNSTLPYWLWHRFILCGPIPTPICLWTTCWHNSANLYC